MDLAPEATEACAEQTEIVIKALRAAAREIDPKFAGHHENVGFAIRRLLNLTQSFLDACRSNDAFRQDAESLRAELDQWRAAYERASREIIECAGNHGAAEARVAELEGERDAALARVAELEAVLAQAAVPLEGLTIAANVGETNLGLGKRAWDEINNAVAHIRSALTTPG
ncbi:hypothetical protein, partial [Pseudogemmobacter sonorensis]|uniref:hypothetical protein n=1 Tax=Pseudogemmobacter sonorensis TaxID=2989681 RepID=UPI0036CEAAAA